MVAQERGSVIPGFPPQIFTNSQILKLLQKVWVRLCCARAVLAAGHSIGLVAPVSVYLGGFLSDGSVFLLICFAGILLTKDQFLQLVREPSGAPCFVGWLSESGVFSHKDLSFQEGGMCVSQYRGETMLYSMQTIFLILYCVLACTYLFSVRAFPMPMNKILFWVQVSCISASSRYDGPWLYAGERAETWLLHP